MLIFDRIETTEFIIEKDDDGYSVKQKNKDQDWSKNDIELKVGDSLKLPPLSNEQRLFLFKGLLKGPTGIERVPINVWRIEPVTEAMFVAVSDCKVMHLVETNGS